MQKNILITGASGFVGSTAVDRALKLGYNTYAGIRSSSSREFLKDDRIHFIDLQYNNFQILKEQLSRLKSEIGRFDVIVHVAGVTKALNKADFEKVNYLQTKFFIDALIETDCVPDSFIFISSLCSIGAGDEKGYSPIQANHIPNPNTAYGKSKLLAENYIKSLTDFPYVILRPTGIYGPRDKDYLILMRAVKKGLNVGAGFKKQLLTFIYIDDLIKVIFLCIDKNIMRKEYYVSDGDVYTDSEFNTIVQNALNKRFVLRLKIPLWIVNIVAWFSEKISGWMGKVSTLNTDKFKIMKQRNWCCDVSSLQNELDFKADFRLKDGVEKTILWYKDNGWM